MRDDRNSISNYKREILDKENKKNDSLNENIEDNYQKKSSSNLLYFTVILLIILAIIGGICAGVFIQGNQNLNNDNNTPFTININNTDEALQNNFTEPNSTELNESSDTVEDYISPYNTNQDTNTYAIEQTKVEFRQVDKNNNGYLSQQEIMSYYGLSFDDALNVIMKYESTHHGLNVEDFIKWGK